MKTIPLILFYLPVLLFAQENENISSHPDSSLYSMLDIYFNKLGGEWIADEWGGNLVESWYLDEVGRLRQSSFFTENGKITYRASSTIMVLEGKLLLVAVVNETEVKIYQATHITERVLTFENQDYQNPDRIVYKFSDDFFKRILSGVEQKKPVSYTINFRRRTLD